MALEPAGHRVLVRPDVVEEVTPGGIILPVTKKDDDKYKQVFGTLIRIGITAWKDYSEGTPWAAVGDRVVFSLYGGVTLADPDTGEEFRLLQDEDIIAIVRS